MQQRAGEVAWLAERCEQHRERLRAMAYRMLRAGRIRRSVSSEGPSACGFPGGEQCRLIADPRDHEQSRLSSQPGLRISRCQGFGVLGGEAEALGYIRKRAEPGPRRGSHIGWFHVGT